MTYFCNTCGLRFEAGPERDELGLLNDIRCPAGCGLDVYPDTAAGAAESVRETLRHEGKMIECGSTMISKVYAFTYRGADWFFQYFGPDVFVPDDEVAYRLYDQCGDFVAEFGTPQDMIHFLAKKGSGHKR